MKYRDLCERIIANSVASTENFYKGTACWEWISTHRRNGRPTINMRAKSGPRKGQVITHTDYRIAVREFTDRRVTPKMVILHLCNNSNCVNPEHLLGGTQKKNVQQCVREGRHFTPFRKAA